MTQDPASLDNLRDIVLPAPVPWLPPAVGWRLVCAAVAAALLVGSWRAFLRWRANAYRREALRELRRLEASSGGAPAKTAADLSALMKRAALSAYQRDAVAELTGPQWLAFLDRTAGTTDFTGGPARVMWSLACGDARGPANLESLFAAARQWLHKHRSGEGLG